MKGLPLQITLCILTFLINANCIHAQQFQWVHGGGATSSTNEQTDFMCTDPHGNIYALSLVGNGPVTADTFNGTAYSSPDNILITSYNCNGQMRWAKLITSSGGDCTPYGIAADSLGNIYVAGNYYQSGQTTYIGHDTAIHGTASQYLIIGLVQFDTSGHFNWIRYVGNNTLATAEGTGALYNPITLDNANNVHYFCYVRSGVTLMAGVTSVYGTYDLTYNPAGTLLSAVRLDLDSEFYIQGGVIDPATKKLYAYGQGGTSGGLDTFFAAAYDASRNLIWQYFADAGATGYASYITGVALDHSKHLHFAGGGDFSSFGFNGDTVYNTHFSGLTDISVIMTTDTNGTVEWIKHYDGDLDINGFNAITLLPNNKIAAIGTFEGEVIDDGGTNVITPAGDGAGPYFVIVDSAGDLQTMQQIYGIGTYNDGLAATSDKVGNLYIGGDVQDSIWAGTPPIPAYHSIGGTSDFFVMKYGVACSCTSMPVAAYTSTGTSTVSFTYTGTTTGIDSMRWNFGDGGTSTLTNPTYTYTAAGTFQACVTVYTDCGHDSICNDFVIPCVAAPTASYTTTGTSNMTFAYTGTTAGLDSVVWNYGDGSTDTGLTTLHTYTATGTYTVCATAYSPCGNNIYCNTIVVTCLAPSIASFTDTGSQTIGFTYTGTTVGIDSVVWSYGDGSMDTGMIAFHTYAASGSYTVCVTVYTSCGSDTSCSDIVVIGLGVPIISLANVQVFPNPTTNELHVNGILQNASYRLLDVAGQCIQQGVLKYGSNTLSMKTVAAGVYILEMTGSNGERDMVRVVKE